MTSPRQLIRVPAAVVLVILLLGSLLSFGLGQEARAVVMRLPIAHTLSDIVSRQAPGALGARILAVPAPRGPTFRHSIERRTATKRLSEHVTSSDPLSQCAPSNVAVESGETVQLTPGGIISSSVLICASAIPSDGHSNTTPANQPSASAPSQDAWYHRDASWPSYFSTRWTAPDYWASLHAFSQASDAGIGDLTWYMKRAQFANQTVFGHGRGYDQAWQPWGTEASIDPFGATSPLGPAFAFFSAQPMSSYGDDFTSVRP